MLSFTMNRGVKCLPNHKKKCIYLQARIHAAETPGSLVMSEIIRQFTEQPERYEKILSNYIVKLIPMINPDGVTIGNSRSSLVGVDLNRRWTNPHCVAHPEIYFLKETMREF
jgi:murein tripeptide amidase MpaA